jgi:hypothetical protein
MLDKRIFTLETESGLKFQINYHQNGDMWINLANEWYFRSFHKGSFERFTAGKACHQLLEGEPVKDDTLLAKLQEAKNYYLQKNEDQASVSL